MHGKFIIYAVIVSLITTVSSWGKLMSGSGGTSGGGSSWSSSSGGSSWGSGGSHK
jgi:hypothetical protein